jgi:light-regulated signal transduction histidine kinase (bacteriophytochrome)
LIQQYKGFETINIPNLDELPLEAEAEKEVWSQTGIHSFIAIPLSLGKTLIGEFHISTIEPKRWQEEDINLLKVLGEVFVYALERKRAEDEIWQLNATLEQRVIERTKQLEAANRELEAFSYSVSHDLRAPLRSLDGFSQILLEDYADILDENAIGYLNRIRSATQRMTGLIEDMLKLSRVSQVEMHREDINLSDLVRDILEEFQSNQPHRKVETIIPESIPANADRNLMHIILTNLLSNAWKFSSKHEKTRIEIGSLLQDEKLIYFIRDDGAGFDMKFANNLFGAFQRMHSDKDFEGTGVGLAIVQRIIHRHGGSIWAESAVEKGTTIYFTL